MTVRATLSDVFREDVLASRMVLVIAGTHEIGKQGIGAKTVASGLANTYMARAVMAGEVGRRRMVELPLGLIGAFAVVVSLLYYAASLILGQTLNPNAGGFLP